MSIKSYALPFALALTVAGGSAFAELQLVEQSTKTEGATTITWDSSFHDTDYTVGADITMSVNWDVDAGFADFDGFTLRGPRFTPKGPDPAKGTLSGYELGNNSAGTGTSGDVAVTFSFSELHCDEERGVEIGNAHFSLFLEVDTVGDGAADSVVGYGVNVHVEGGTCEPAEDPDNGGPPPGAGRPVNPGPPPGIPRGRP